MRRAISRCFLYLDAVRKEVTSGLGHWPRMRGARYVHPDMLLDVNMAIAFEEACLKIYWVFDFRTRDMDVAS